MKKFFSYLVLIIFIFGTTGFFALDALAIVYIPLGSVIKGKGMPTLYYLGDNGKRYVFPSDKIYFSWYDDFSNVKEINDNELYSYPLGGNVRYKPGALLIKIQTDPKVYAVGPNGMLHWIMTEEVASALYGDNWNKLIDDVPDSFFFDYFTGSPVESEDDFDPDGQSEAYPTISHNHGWKTRVYAQIKAGNEKKCAHLLSAVNQFQKRVRFYGFSPENIGTEYLETCYGVKDNEPNSSAPYYGNKVRLCFADNTIDVSAQTARFYLEAAATLGACGSDDEKEISEDADYTASFIDNIIMAAATNTAVISWMTVGTSTGMIIYSDEHIASSSYVFETLSAIASTSHSLLIDGLATTTQYYFIIRAANEAGIITESEEYDFTTF